MEAEFWMSQPINTWSTKLALNVRQGNPFECYHNRGKCLIVFLLFFFDFVFFLINHFPPLMWSLRNESQCQSGKSSYEIYYECVGNICFWWDQQLSLKLKEDEENIRQSSLRTNWFSFSTLGIVCVAFGIAKTNSTVCPKTASSCKHIVMPGIVILLYTLIHWDKYTNTRQHTYTHTPTGNPQTPVHDSNQLQFSSCGRYARMARHCDSQTTNNLSFSKMGDNDNKLNTRKVLFNRRFGFFSHTPSGTRHPPPTINNIQ